MGELWIGLGNDYHNQSKTSMARSSAKKTKKVIDEGVPKLASARLGDVVDCYEHAALAMFPRARYMPGRDARFIFWPVSLLPEWLADKICINPESPIPAAAK